MARLEKRDFQQYLDKKGTSPILKAAGAEELYRYWEKSIGPSRPKLEIFCAGVLAGAELALRHVRETEKKG